MGAFDVFGSVLAHYPTTGVIPLLIAVVLLFAGIVALGLRREKLSLAKIVLASLVFLGSLLVVPIVVALVWQMVCLLHSEYRSLPWGETYNRDLYVVSFVTLATSIASLSYTLLRKKTGTENLMVGALFWWLILAIVTSLYLPGGSYLFVWPLFFSLVGSGLALVSQEPTSAKCTALLSLCAAPGVILVAPTIHMILAAMSLAMAGAVMVREQRHSNPKHAGNFTTASILYQNIRDFASASPRGRIQRKAGRSQRYTERGSAMGIVVLGTSQRGCRANPRGRAFPSS